MSLPKVAVFGAGNVGAAVAQRILEKDLADVVLIDIVEGLAAGKALDLTQAGPVEGYQARIIGTTDPAAIEGADVVIITAGLARKPGMSREELLSRNAAIVGGIADHVKQHAPEAIVIVVTNPLDVMAYHVYRRTGFPKPRVMGMAGVLDSARLRAFVAAELNVSAADVAAMVLGSHGDSMVPLIEGATVGGRSLAEKASTEQIEALVQRTRQAGAEIVGLLKTGSAFYAPSASAVAMLAAILNDTKTVLPASVLLEGDYGIDGVFLGVPVELGSNGVERIVPLPLSPEAQRALADGAERVRKGITLLPT